MTEEDTELYVYLYLYLYRDIELYVYFELFSKPVQTHNLEKLQGCKRRRCWRCWECWRKLRMIKTNLLGLHHYIINGKYWLGCFDGGNAETWYLLCKLLAGASPFRGPSGGLVWAARGKVFELMGLYATLWRKFNGISTKYEAVPPCTYYVPF